MAHQGSRGTRPRHEHTPYGFGRWLNSTNHKDIGTMYLLFAIVGGLIGGFLSVVMRMELQEPGLQYFANGHMFNVFVTGPRPHHGVLHGDAGHDRRLRQLVRAADDRRAGHGLPAHEQHLVLAAAGLVRAAADVDVRRRAARHARRRRRLDGLCAAVDLGPPGPGHGLRHPVAAPRRCLLDPRRHQLHHHHLQHARAGHDAAQDAAVRVERAGDGLPAAAVAARAGRRHHHAADRPQLRHHVLQCRRRRRSAALPAPVLVLRPPRGLHPDPAWLRHDQPGGVDVLAQARVRLPRHGLRHGRHRLHRLHRLGAPHVHVGHGRRRPGLLRVRHHGDRGADRREDLLLDRHHVGRLDPVPRADAVGARASSSCSRSAASPA